MTDLEVLIDLLDDLIHDVKQLIEPLTQEELTWQPAPQSNNISVTVWHFSRWLDLLTVRALQNRPQTEEQWFQHWAEATGYDPSGVGFGGFGAITGYTWEEVLAIPSLSTEDLLTYFAQVTVALREYLSLFPVEKLHAPAQGLGSEHTNYDWIKNVLKGCLWHVGEIQAIKAMQKQQIVN